MSFKMTVNNELGINIFQSKYIYDKENEVN